MYFITTMSKEHGSRCVGYYATEQDAVDTVIHNSCDSNEAGYYLYAVIENIEEGIYQYDTTPIWFKYNQEIDEYVKSDRPDFIPNNHVGFGIG